MNPSELTLSTALNPISIQDDRRRFHARFVRAGAIVAADGSPTNIIVSPESLSRAVERGLFNHKAVFVDHAGFFENPSVHDIAGNTLNAILAGDSVEGEIELYSTPTGEEIAAISTLFLIPHPGIGRGAGGEGFIPTILSEGESHTRTNPSPIA